MRTTNPSEAIGPKWHPSKWHPSKWHPSKWHPSKWHPSKWHPSKSHKCCLGHVSSVLLPIFGRAQ